ncbi:MAG: CHC2 zinc finger domain-containing protein [Pseudomonadota bacterium]
MTLVDLIPDLTRKTAKEYAGACPWCGGEDRFIVFQETGRYWCRQCGKRGDTIQYLRETKGLSYQEACEALDVEPRNNGNGRRRTPEPFTGRLTVSPGERWQEQARAFLNRTERCLWTEQGKEGLNFLRDRSVTDKTIRTARLGWNPVDHYQLRKAWGLPDNGKKLWLPAGLVIPYQEQGRVIRLRLRRFRQDDWGRYILISGSDTRAMLFPGNPDNYLVVESELDGLLIHQEAGDLVSAVALGSAQARPDRETHRLLSKAKGILVSLDSDPAGAAAAWGFWNRTYRQAKRWPCIRGKDPADMAKAGVSINQWVEAGL